MKGGVLRNRIGRSSLAFVLSLSAHIAVIVFFMLFKVCSLDSVGDISGPVLIRIGTETPDADIMKAAKETAETAPNTTQTNTVPKQAQASPTAPAPTPVPKQQAQTTTPAQPKPAEQAAKQPEKPIEPQPVSIKGTEAGNSFEIQFIGSNSEVRRSLAVPILLYMPLPNILPASLVASNRDKVVNGEVFATADKIKAQLLKYYSLVKGEYQLKGFIQPEFGNRPDIWSILEDNGYDMRNPEYKAGKNLRAIQIRFTVLPSTGKEGAKLVNLKIVISSGYSDIDEAVIFGFMQGAFSNKSKREIDALFTYRF